MLFLTHEFCPGNPRNIEGIPIISLCYYFTKGIIIFGEYVVLRLQLALILSLRVGF